MTATSGIGRNSGNSDLKESASNAIRQTESKTTETKGNGKGPMKKPNAEPGEAVPKTTQQTKTTETEDPRVASTQSSESLANQTRASIPSCGNRKCRIHGIKVDEKPVQAKSSSQKAEKDSKGANTASSDSEKKSSSTGKAVTFAESGAYTAKQTQASSKICVKKNCPVHGKALQATPSSSTDVDETPPQAKSLSEIAEEEFTAWSKRFLAVKAKKDTTEHAKTSVPSCGNKDCSIHGLNKTKANSLGSNVGDVSLKPGELSTKWESVVHDSSHPKNASQDLSDCDFGDGIKARMPSFKFGQVSTDPAPVNVGLTSAFPQNTQWGKTVAQPNLTGAYPFTLPHVTVEMPGPATNVNADRTSIAPSQLNSQQYPQKTNESNTDAQRNVTRSYSNSSQYVAAQMPAPSASSNAGQIPTAQKINTGNAVAKQDVAGGHSSSSHYVTVQAPLTSANANASQNSTVPFTVFSQQNPQCVSSGSTFAQQTMTAFYTDTSEHITAQMPRPVTNVNAGQTSIAPAQVNAKQNPQNIQMGNTVTQRNVTAAQVPPTTANVSADQTSNAPIVLTSEQYDQIKSGKAFVICNVTATYPDTSQMLPSVASSNGGHATTEIKSGESAAHQNVAGSYSNPTQYVMVQMAPPVVNVSAGQTSNALEKTAVLRNVPGGYPNPFQCAINKRPLAMANTIARGMPNSPVFVAQQIQIQPVVPNQLNDQTPAPPVYPYQGRYAFSPEKNQLKYYSNGLSAVPSNLNAGTVNAPVLGKTSQTRVTNYQQSSEQSSDMDDWSIYPEDGEEGDDYVAEKMAKMRAFREMFESRRHILKTSLYQSIFGRDAPVVEEQLQKILKLEAFTFFRSSNFDEYGLALKAAAVAAKIFKS